MAGPRIVLGLPLGLGKACSIANSLFERAVREPALHLQIFTALTLEAPRPGGELERRFLQPVIDRTMGGYPQLAYANALRAGSLPANIQVNEFFFLAGRWLAVAEAQQGYVSANYTHAVRYLVDRGVNVIAQLVASKAGTAGYSLSCNTDLTLDFLSERARGRTKFMLVGELNRELPFMPGDAVVGNEQFAHILDDDTGGFPLFGPPKEPLTLADHAIGLHTAKLVVDGGTLQLGIGRESDATVYALTLRHRGNHHFRKALALLGNGEAAENTGPFHQGLYGVSEMLVDGFLTLLKEGILKREVDKALLHAAFFVGTHAFYRALREMPDEDLSRICMSAVSFTNEIGDDSAKRKARCNARFINSTMMATLFGAAISDGLEDGRVVSGVGGQYNFVAQAFELEGARSILTLRATRGSGRQARSNILFSYGHSTIPRHLRDIVVSEYGVADLRGKSDADVVAAMLSIADSRFQPELARRAKDSRKLPSTYEIPSGFRENTPERLSAALRPLSEQGLLPLFPLGSDLDATEERLARLLMRMKDVRPARLVGMALKKGVWRPPSCDEALLLERMGLSKPRTVAERLYRAVLRGAFAEGFAC